MFVKSAEIRFQVVLQHKTVPKVTWVSKSPSPSWHLSGFCHLISPGGGEFVRKPLPGGGAFVNSFRIHLKICLFRYSTYGYF